jgi:hypothetical protein
MLRLPRLVVDKKTGIGKAHALQRACFAMTGQSPACHHPFQSALLAAATVIGDGY